MTDHTPSARSSRRRAPRLFRLAWLSMRRAGYGLQRLLTRSRRPNNAPVVAVTAVTATAAKGTRTAPREPSSSAPSQGGARRILGAAWLTTQRGWSRWTAIPPQHRAWTFAAVTGTLGILLLLWWQWSGHSAAEVAAEPDPEVRLVANDAPDSIGNDAPAPTEHAAPESIETTHPDDLREEPSAAAESREIARNDFPSEPERIDFSPKVAPPVDLFEALPKRADEEPKPTEPAEPESGPIAVTTEPDLREVGPDLEVMIERPAPRNDDLPDSSTGAIDEQFIVSSADPKPEAVESAQPDGWGERTPAPVSEPLADDAALDDATSLPEAPAAPAPAEVPRLSTVEPGPKNLKVSIVRRGPAESSLGQPLRYELLVRNDGDQPVPRVVVEDKIPPQHRVVNVSPPAEFGGQVLRWNLADLAAGEERVLNVVLIPRAAGVAEGTARMKPFAHVASDTQVAPPPLEFRLVVPREVGLGAECVVGFRVTNPGPVAVENVRVLYDLPAELKYAKGRALEYQISRLEPGETREGLLTARGGSLGAGICRGELELAGQKLGPQQAAITVSRAVAAPAPRSAAGMPFWSSPNPWPCCR